MYALLVRMYIPNNSFTRTYAYMQYTIPVHKYTGMRRYLLHEWSMDVPYNSYKRYVILRTLVWTYLCTGSLCAHNEPLLPSSLYQTTQEEPFLWMKSLLCASEDWKVGMSGGPYLENLLSCAGRQSKICDNDRLIAWDSVLEEFDGDESI